MNIHDLKLSHLEEAYKLFTASYQRQREEVPILNESNATAEKIIPMLKWCLEKHSGVAVYENGEMIGYMTGFYIDGLLGVNKGAYCPEWAHGSVNEKAFEIYRLMYQAIGQRWVADGCLTHAINFMNHAQAAHEAYFWNGFGSVCIDAIRPVEPIKAETLEGLHITPIQEKDISAWLPLIDGHNRHLATAPAFKPYLKPETEDELSNMLRQPGNHAWMAWIGSEAVGYMKVAPVENGAAWMVNGERKVAVNGAYVKPEYRGKGIAKMLLATVMDWAAKEGFIRCSVDFEATNLEACRFWLKHFNPVCRSMVRRLDDRIMKSISR